MQPTNGKRKKKFPQYCILPFQIYNLVNDFLTSHIGEIVKKTSFFFKLSPVEWDTADDCWPRMLSVKLWHDYHHQQKDKDSCSLNLSVRWFKLENTQLLTKTCNSRELTQYVTENQLISLWGCPGFNSTQSTKKSVPCGLYLIMSASIPILLSWILWQSHENIVFYTLRSRWFYAVVSIF